VIVDRESVAAALPGLEIGELLGSGAYGLVLAGRHRHLRHHVAIKVLPAGFAAQVGGPRGASEGQLLGRMDHPHIVRVYDYVETADLCLIVMEQLVGGTLTRRRDAMRPEAACAVGLAVASALGYAHDRGVLHRDIKPDNVLFTAAGTAKVTDFGVAKLLEGTVATASAQVGTPLYMAPEQIASGQLGPATDVYALGVVLYHLLSGAPPFDRSLPVQELWRRRLSGPPPRPRGVPPPVADVVLRTLAPDPAARYPSARAFGLDFAAAAGAVLGRGWLSRSELQVQLDDDVRAAADGPPTGPRAAPARPPAMHPGPPTVVGPTSGLAAGAGTSDGPTLPVGGRPAPTAWAAQVPLPGRNPGAPGGPRRSRWLQGRWLAVAAAVCALAVVLPLVLIPRGGDRPQAGPSAGAPTPTTAATPAAGPRIAPVGAVLHPSADRGGTLRVGAIEDCDSWDPARSNTDSCWAQQRWFTRQLLTYKPGTTDLIGDLATGVPTSTDARTWQYTLRPGLAYEDGSPITSRDIKYGLERLFDAQLVTNGLKGVTRYLDDPNSPYPGPYKDPSPDKLGLTSVETPDDQTIIFHLTKPFGDWNYLMAMPASTPVPKAKDRGTGYADHPLSSGPYKFASYQRGQSLTLVRNTKWDPATDPVNTALPDRIEVSMLGHDRSTIDEQILAGHTDVFGAQTGVADDTLARMQTDAAMRTKPHQTVTSGVLRFLGLTTTVAPLDNVHCRKAVAWAVDRQAQVEARGGPVRSIPATTLVPPPMRYHSALDPYPSADGHGDVAAARSELAACGQPAGFTVKLVIVDEPKSRSQALALQTSLARIGVTVQFTPMDADAFFKMIFTSQTMHDQGIGMTIVGYNPGWPTAGGVLGLLADGRRITPADNRNIAALADPAVNTAIDDAFLADLTDSAAPASPSGLAATRWAAVERMVLDSAAYVPMTFEQVTNVYSLNVTNVFYQPAYDTVDFAALGVR
jgi:peptide/nickel transport system substrate-binding protein